MERWMDGRMDWTDGWMDKQGDSYMSQKTVFAEGIVQVYIILIKTNAKSCRGKTQNLNYFDLISYLQ